MFGEMFFVCKDLYTPLIKLEINTNVRILFIASYSLHTPSAALLAGPFSNAAVESSLCISVFPMIFNYISIRNCRDVAVMARL